MAIKYDFETYKKSDLWIGESCQVEKNSGVQFHRMPSFRGEYAEAKAIFRITWPKYNKMSPGIDCFKVEATEKEGEQLFFLKRADVAAAIERGQFWDVDDDFIRNLKGVDDFLEVAVAGWERCKDPPWPKSIKINLT